MKAERDTNNRPGKRLITMWVSDEQWDTWRAAAASQGLVFSEFARETLDRASDKFLSLPAANLFCQQAAARRIGIGQSTLINRAKHGHVGNVRPRNSARILYTEADIERETEAAAERTRILTEEWNESHGRCGVDGDTPLGLDRAGRSRA